MREALSTKTLSETPFMRPSLTLEDNRYTLEVVRNYAISREGDPERTWVVFDPDDDITLPQYVTLGGMIEYHLNQITDEFTWDTITESGREPTINIEPLANIINPTNPIPLAEGVTTLVTVSWNAAAVIAA